MKLPPPTFRITLNGREQDLTAPLSVAGLLEALGCSDKRIAVERNGEIIPKSLYPTTALLGGDRVEIVIAVGGG